MIPRLSFAVLATAIALCSGAMPGLASDNAAWMEPAFELPVGSRWEVTVHEREEYTRGDKFTWYGKTFRSEMTVHERTGDGYRVTYVIGGASVDGNDGEVEPAKYVADAIKGLRIRALLGANGAPEAIEEIENYDILPRSVMEHFMQYTDVLKDESRKFEALRNTLQMYFITMIGHDQTVPEFFLKGLAELALGHNTGLQPGDVRESSIERIHWVPFFGGALAIAARLELVDADPAKGEARYVRTEQSDPKVVAAGLSAMAARILEHKGETAVNLEERARWMVGQRPHRSARTEIFVGGGRAWRAQTELLLSDGLDGGISKRHISTVTMARLQ